MPPTNPHPLKLGPQGRLVIPSDVRKLLKLHAGDTLVAWVEDGGLVLRRRDAAKAELRALCRVPGRKLADELIAERRREAKRESED
jgi:AbrB family looped-hinge helix DNA binding protein